MSHSFACPACGTSLEYPGSGDTVQCPSCQAVVHVPGTMGADLPGEQVSFEAEIQRLVRADQKIEAIKLYRAKYLVGLAEAKAAVEALGRGETVLVPAAAAPLPRMPGNPADYTAAVEKIKQAAQANQKIEAIKLYRELYEVGLAEAKDAVEAYMRNGILPGVEAAAGPAVQSLNSNAEAVPAQAAASIAQFMRAGKKIEAIKVYRALYLVGLAEAKQAVEDYERTGVLNAPVGVPAAGDAGEPSLPVVHEVGESGGPSKLLIGLAVLLVVAGVIVWIAMRGF